MIRDLHKAGIREDDDAIAILRIYIANIMVLCIVPFALSYFPIFFLNKQYATVLIYSVLILLMLLGYYLNYRHHIVAARRIIFSVSALFIMASLTTYGRGTELQSLMPILVIFIFVLFEKNSEYFIFCLYITLVFACSFLYLDIYGPRLANAAVKYDYYVNMAFAIFSCGVVSYMVMKTLKKYVFNNKKSYQKLEEQNRVINKQNEEMNLFTSMASHDLKTPSRTIISYLGLLEKKGTVTDPKSLQYLHQAMASANQMYQLVEGISMLKKLDNQKSPGDYVQTDDLLDSVISTMNIGGDPTIKVTGSSLPNIKVAGTQLYHLFQNLIENAIKYNESELKVINIKSEVTTDHIIIRIEDNGIGIPEEYIEHVFEPFKKLHSTAKYTSTGLGLSICKKIMSQYEGSIYAESNGKGTTMVLKFPMSLLVE